MCIIIVKPRGKEVPSKDIFKNCFKKNPDGAGLMYPVKVKDGQILENSSLEGVSKIHIEKGFMDFEDFWDTIECRVEDGFITKEDHAVFHCRIKTHGVTEPINTHPFPISNKIGDLRATEFDTDLAVAHNGTISKMDTKHGNSDTQVFIKTFLSKVADKIKKQDKDIHKEISDLGGWSKFAFLTPDKLTMLGSGWEHVDGIHYSNGGYKEVVIAPYKAPTLPYYENKTMGVMGELIEDFWDFYLAGEMNWNGYIFSNSF